MIINENNMLIKYFEEDIDIAKEKHQVSKSNQIQLEYIPNKDLDISVYNESKEEITEFELGDVGVITFSNDLSKAIVYVDYTAIGKWMISSEKVYINYTNRDEILETLEDLILQQYEIIEQVKVIGDVQTIITKMQGNIDNLRELYDIVLNNETILENIKVRIEECIAEKDRMVNALNDVISTANTSKQALEQATNTANTTKDDIVNTTNTCKSEINNLISGKKTEMTSFTNEKKEELTTTSTGCVNNVNTAISNADSKIDELNEWVANNGDIVDLDRRVKNIKNHLFHNNKIKMIAHRGFSGYAPENTIPAFRLAGSNKYWGTECDIHETADGKFVIMHDDTLDRTTNGTGSISSKTLEEIKGFVIDSGTFITYNPTLKVPTLEEYLQVCKEYNLIPVIEIKNLNTNSITNFLAILKAYQVLECCLIISFDKTVLENIRSMNEKIEIAYLSNTMTSSDIEYCSQNRFHINVAYSVITKELIEESHSKDVLVGAWTIDDKTTIDTLISNGIDFITTNGYIRGKEYELHKPYVEIDGLHYGRHTYGNGVPYELAHSENLTDKTRIWSDKLNKLEGWETKVGSNIKIGFQVAVLFYDENKVGINDLGWLPDNTSLDIPANAVYYELYLGTPDGRNIEMNEWPNLRKIRALLF